MDHPFKTSACLRGGGVKNLPNLPNLPTDSTKKLPTVGGEGSKICESCRRLKWMVPVLNFLKGLQKTYFTLLESIAKNLFYGIKFINQKKPSTI